jgi:Nif-specific regulatory protein
MDASTDLEFPADVRTACHRAIDPTLDYRAVLRLSSVVGSSPALATMLHGLRSAAAFDRLTVLLTGETGTGKTLVARVLHENSPRREGPFVAVNCAAIPAELWEAEIFGTARNAYTNAAERPGRFAAADAGTLFLDEVGELPLEHQAKLLRVLDAGCYERLGEDRTRVANVRIVAATNRPLEAAIRAGTFRADLFFRLNRFRIRVPSLEERREDIAELAVVLAEQESKHLNVICPSFSSEALELLQARSWPGNVRELQSAVGQAVIEATLCGSPEIGPEHCLVPGEPLPEEREAGQAPGRTERPTLASATRVFQRELIVRTLADEHQNVSRAALALGIARSHLYTLMRELGVERRDRGAMPQARC